NAEQARAKAGVARISNRRNKVRDSEADVVQALTLVLQDVHRGPPAERRLDELEGDRAEGGLGHVPADALLGAVVHGIHREGAARPAVQAQGCTESVDGRVEVAHGDTDVIEVRVGDDGAAPIECRRHPPGLASSKATSAIAARPRRYSGSSPVPARHTHGTAAAVRANSSRCTSS